MVSTRKLEWTSATSGKTPGPMLLILGSSWMQRTFTATYQFGIPDYAWQDVCKKKGSEAPPHLGAKPGTPWVFRFYGAVGKDFKSKLHFVPPSPDPKNLKHKKSSETFKSEHFIEMMKNLHEEIQTYTAGRRGGWLQAHHGSCQATLLQGQQACLG